jgi:hypothetical protein
MGEKDLGAHMKRLIITALLAMFLAACASGQGTGSRTYGHQGESWQCAKMINGDAYSYGKTPCDR